MKYRLGAVSNRLKLVLLDPNLVSASAVLRGESKARSQVWKWRSPWRISLLNLAESYSKGCLFVFFQIKTFLLTGSLCAGRTHKLTSTTPWSLMSGRERHRSTSDGLLVPQMCRVLSILVQNLFASYVQNKLVDGNRIVMPEDGICFPVNI